MARFRYIVFSSGTLSGVVESLNADTARIEMGSRFPNRRIELHQVKLDDTLKDIESETRKRQTLHLFKKAV